MARKSRLNAYTREWIAQHNRTIAALAQEVGSNENSFGSWLARNSYPRELIPRLGEVMGIGTDIEMLSRQFEFQVNAKRGPAPRIGSTSEADAESNPELDTEEVGARDSRPTASGAADFLESIRSRIQELRAGDCFAWIGLDQLPPELDVRYWPMIAEDLVSAMLKDVDFVYLHAGPLPLHTEAPLADDEDPDDPPLVLRTSDFVRDGADWTLRLRSLEENLRSAFHESGIKADAVRERIEGRFHAAAIGHSPFMTPGHLYASIRYHNQATGLYDHDGLCRFPARGGPLLLRLAEHEAMRLQEFVAHVIDVEFPGARAMAHRVSPPKQTPQLKIVPQQTS